MPTIRNIETTTSGIIKEMTDAPPLSFKSIGEPLIDWSIDGANGGVGDRTENLFDYTTQAGSTVEGNHTATADYYLNDSGAEISLSGWWISDYIEITQDTATVCNVGGQSVSICAYDENKTFVRGQAYLTGSSTKIGNITISTQNAKYVRFSFVRSTMGLNAMLIDGSAVPSNFVPYGYKIPVTCGGETKTVYLDEPLGDSDSISMTDTGISIPTVSGSNTLSVETAVQPSEVYIKYEEGGDEMVTLVKIGGKYNIPLLEIRGLSTDTKPTTKIEGMVIANGSTYIEIDTGDTYMFDAENGVWHNITG